MGSGPVYLDYVGKDTFYGLLASLRGQLFSDDDFAEIYGPDHGRDSVPPSLLATALLLQTYDKVSDAEAKARADFDIRWKVALGIEIEDRPLAKSTLQMFRAQLILHEKVREIPIRTSTGEEIRLSLGRHNRLQALVVSDFGPRFAPGSVLLYLGDADDKLLHLDREKLDQLGVPVNEHDKLPDVVLYDEGRNWLFLVEAVTSHGPVSPKRVGELEDSLKNCTATRIYVSAFPDFRQFRRHLDNIAWETEVWIAEIPDHLIHFNGDKFLGPKSDI